MLAIVHSATLSGVSGRPVSVEVHVQAGGLPTFTIVGLPDTSCRESRDRVRAALLSSGLDWPQRRVTVNLAPSAVRKSGAGLDVAIAVGILAASGVIDPELIADTGFLGELGLDGSIRPVTGALPLADAVAAERLVVAPGNGVEASLIRGDSVHPVRSVAQLLRCLVGDEPWPAVQPPGPTTKGPALPDIGDIRGQQTGKFAIELAAAGGHHLLMVGPPGAGKTMLARRLPSLLPPLQPCEALEVTRIHSAAGELDERSGLRTVAPFRSPHHGASAVSLVGGGSSTMRPGEVSLAHRGVLFLDELGEFSSSALDGLRQPLEEGEVRVSRLNAGARYPAAVLLVAAMNPCPCGESGAPGACRCTDAARARYHRRLSGPLLDRFDLRIGVQRPDSAELFGTGTGESSAEVAARVALARHRASVRSGRLNSRLTAAELDEHSSLEPAAQALLENAVREGRLSARGVGRVRAVGRTIADLAIADPDRPDQPLTVEQVSLAKSLRVDPFGFVR